MKTTIVCGMLGAGKTTFIQNTLKHSGEKTVVLVNDFGNTGIDGEILSLGGIDAIELPSGCVCCTLKYDLITTVDKVIKELKPHHLIIEPSGVASPSGVLEALGSLKIHPVTVIGIVDSTEFIELCEAGMYGDFFKDQIINSDIVLVNKTDLANGEKTEKTIDLVGAMNERAVIIPTVRAVLNEPLPERHHKYAHHEKREHILHFQTLSLHISNGKSVSTCNRIFQDLAKGAFGKVIRAKALVQTDRGPFRVDLSSGKVDLVPFARPVTVSRIVIIGERLKEVDLKEIIESM